MIPAGVDPYTNTSNFLSLLRLLRILTSLGVREDDDCDRAAELAITRQATTTIVSRRWALRTTSP
eukprot:CAMPEP_0197451036 /NCGR_PEP_ID=MMETSP1175-20131217/27438_1 /TAXON_ID=1003142 /ORGANISM="Triceratium dubium, Strain CCMP147" /LENGTH=64 /DNA_ID=CAMNT_0042983637 /DNA_START=98 /DNA_END=289 /DNA_ORIENTATION=-